MQAVQQAQNSHQYNKALARTALASGSPIRVGVTLPDNMFHAVTDERELIESIVGCAADTLAGGVFDSDKAAEVARHGRERLVQLGESPDSTV